MATLLFIISVWYERPEVTIREFPSETACQKAAETILNDLKETRASTKWSITCVPKE